MTAERHDGADTRPAAWIERSDAIDAAGALGVLASEYERRARSRRYGGPACAQYRRDLRRAAEVYRAAARRVQAAADATA